VDVRLSLRRTNVALCRTDPNEVISLWDILAQLAINRTACIDGIEDRLRDEANDSNFIKFSHAP